ncbi:MAG: tRNA dihydrouridine synthase DusB [Armatimonadetes bacterium]|nr:tRNA dihydrouridine synthase DusB [Armatimonadota bacterium]
MAPVPGFLVGGVRVDPPLLLAPMEDVTSLPMRLIAKRIGRPGLVFTEFVSAMAVHYGAKKTFRKFRIDPRERPLAIQIFGGDEDTMVEAAKLCEESGADTVDINMGCWVPKVCRTGAGAALLKDPDLAERIVAAVVRSVSVPVTVKVRAGWDYSLFAAPELAKRFVGAGAKMITLHARFAKQGFEGEADWRLIHELRAAVDVPLVGNGDVKTPEDARRMVEETGCDGVMVGRAAISDPWRLARIRCGLTGESPPDAPTLHDRIAVALEHARAMVEYERDEDTGGNGPSPESRGLRALRGQLPLYIKGEHGAAQVRGRLSTVDSLAELEDVLRTFAAAEVTA